MGKMPMIKTAATAAANAMRSDASRGGVLGLARAITRRVPVRGRRASLGVPRDATCVTSRRRAEQRAHAAHAQTCTSIAAHVRHLERAERIERRAVADVRALTSAPTLRAINAAASLRNPRLMRLLTVPSGCCNSAAISVCVFPS